jgi:hypothetical protein
MHIPTFSCAMSQLSHFLYRKVPKCCHIRDVKGAEEGSGLSVIMTLIFRRIVNPLSESSMVHGPVSTVRGPGWCGHR